MSWVLNAIVVWEVLENAEKRCAEINAALHPVHGQVCGNDGRAWDGGRKRLRAASWHEPWE